MDETALAIARLREDARPDKSSEPDHPSSDDMKAKGSLARKVTGHQKAVGGAPSASTNARRRSGAERSGEGRLLLSKLLLVVFVFAPEAEVEQGGHPGRGGDPAPGDSAPR